MTFGLTNAPSTFEGLMNSIFNPFLRKFVLVFFDDIIIYNNSWKDHVEHVDRVLQLLEEKRLYEKGSKCFFGAQEVEYLGHFCCCMEGSVIPPFRQRQPFDPLCLFIRNKATKISFQTFIYYLNLPIRLRMIR